VKSPNKIILIDGNSLAYRAFYALPDTMKTTAGIITNAIYGFTTMLLKILDEKPDCVAIAFDLPEPTFRHKEYKQYKATRDKAPPTLYEQMPQIKEVAKAFDIPIYELSGYEADDVIGTLAKEAESQGMDVEILSGDLDPLQLVSDKIKVLTTRKGLVDTVLYGPKEVEERYGLKPEQLIDFKALKGDASDNIPGVPKVGEKTASELLKQFKTLDNIYNNLDKITKKALKENLKNNRALADLSKKLGTIVTNAPIEIDFTKCKREDIDWTRIIPIFEKLEFDRLVKKYSAGQTDNIVKLKQEKLVDFDFQLVTDIAKLIKILRQADCFAFDLETTSLNVFEAKIVGISFSVENKAAYYLPILKPANKFAVSNKDSAELILQNQAPKEPRIHSQVLLEIRPIFQSSQLKIGHNIKYDIEVLKNNGIEVKGPLFDTMVAAYLLDSISNKLSLKKLAKQFLGRDMIKLEEAMGEHEDFSKIPLEIAKDYACSDAEATFSLYEIFKPALKHQKMDKLFYEIEMPLIEVLIEMEMNGVSIDEKLLSQISKDTEKQLKELETHIYAISGEVFNINSPKQLAKILFEKLMLPILKKTKTGPSTNVEVLEELAGQNFEIAQRLMDFRQLTKLKNTYVDVLPTLVNPKTGRIHSSFNQTITATGRLSSSNPNLQNIPQDLRKAFIPGKEDWAIIAADYSQIELRILAHMSGDEELIKAFQEDKDVHQTTADALGITRSQAKTVNFGIIYGMSDFGLSKQLKIKRQQASEFITKYFAKYKGVKIFLDDLIKQAREKGYVETLLGRRRPIPDINSPNQGLRSFAERSAINMPIQGTAADLIKIAMVNISVKLKNQNAKLLLQVHDELVFECPKKDADTLKQLVKEKMESALELKVPVKVDIGIGESWGEAK